MLNVFVCTKNYELLAQLIAIQYQTDHFHIQGFSRSAPHDLDALITEGVHVLYLSFSLIEQCWREWLDAFCALQGQERGSIRLIISFAALKEEHTAMLLRYAIDSYLVEPFDGRQLSALFLQQQRIDIQSRRRQEDVDGRITSLLLELKIPSHLNGFHYLKTACAIAVTLPISRQVVMKNVYSITAKRCHSTSSRVEKCIRSAIHAARMPSDYRRLFHGDPTSRKVIMYVYTCFIGIT